MPELSNGHSFHKVRLEKEIKAEESKKFRFDVKQQYKVTPEEKERVEDIKESAIRQLKVKKVDTKLLDTRNQFLKFFSPSQVNSDLVQVNPEQQERMNKRGIDSVEYKKLYGQLISKIIKPAE